MKFIRINIDYCSYLIITFVLYFVDGGINNPLCGSELVNIDKFTEVKVSYDGFCSDNSASCCQTWEGLVQPGLDILFGKATYIKLNQLNDLVRNIKKSLGDLECHKDSNNPTTPMHNDIVHSIDQLNEINWIRMLNNTFLGNPCGLELTKLLFCASNYCLYNQTVAVQQNQNCHGHCNAIIQNCVTEPFENLSQDWKRAIGSVATSLRILSAKSQCQNDKLVLDTHVTQLNEWRDPVAWIISSCSSPTFNPCFPETSMFNDKAPATDKSLVTHGAKLKSIVTSLEKYWLNSDIISVFDSDDLMSSSSSGSGWNANDQLFTDDEDLLNEHLYGSGSGEVIDHENVDDNVNSGTGTNTVNGVSISTSNPSSPANTNNNNNNNNDNSKKPTNVNDNTKASKSSHVSITLPPFILIMFYYLII